MIIKDGVSYIKDWQQGKNHLPLAGIYFIKPSEFKQLETMSEPESFYPLKAVSRCLPAVRTNKLRLSWFAIGLVVGIGGTLALLSDFNFTSPAVQEAVIDMPVETAANPPQQQPIEEAKPAAGVPQVAQPAPETSEAVYPLTLTLTIESGDTLIEMLTDTGVEYADAHNLVKAIGKAFNVKRLSVGQQLTVELNKKPGKENRPFIESVTLPMSQTSSLEINRTAQNDFEVKKVYEPTERKVKRAQSRIDGSFYETGAKQGLSPSLLAELIQAFSYDVDFQRDVKRGDRLDILYERMETKDGIPAGYGNVLYAELGLGDKTLKIYRYADKKGNADYYNAKGESVRKALLRTPINGAKITSRFGFRTHPILGYSKMHRGVDFGAPTGTPIYAAGDGTVGFASRKGGYGNYLMIRHSNAYATAYGHLSRFARGMAPGKKVKQGQIVAYVGSTGMSTGAHLHYEVLVKNQQVNPAKVKFKTGNTLGKKELASFRATVEQIQAQLATDEKVAMAPSPKKSEVR